MSPESRYLTADSYGFPEFLDFGFARHIRTYIIRS